ncbi:MAG: hypothetical protein H8K10_07460 [Nitrospira sp.]|nr:hypothetical protein [Nitrospira sp.]
MLHPHSASAEWYVAGQFGANLADRLSDIRGTGDLSGFRAPDFDLQKSFLYGAKVGTFPGNGWFGVELDAFHNMPHIKNLDDVPGIHMRVTNVGVNLLARYPGVTFQPYAGIGAGAAIARIGDSATTRGDYRRVFGRQSADGGESLHHPLRGGVYRVQI